MLSDDSLKCDASPVLQFQSWNFTARTTFGAFPLKNALGLSSCHKVVTDILQLITNKICHYLFELSTAVLERNKIRERATYSAIFLENITFSWHE